jgi:hypothetical protein
MQKLERLVSDHLAIQGKATAYQCKRVYALLHVCGMEPVWVDYLSHQHAKILIQKLEQIRSIQTTTSQKETPNE